MPAVPLRFLHASDFHLERPLHGLSYVPDHLRDLLIDAPYVAAERVIDTALARDVDFVVFSGDILDAGQAGPRGIQFVREQLQRLQQQQIPVYWVEGKVDPVDGWPDAVTLPDGVHRFQGPEVATIAHHRQQEPIATIMAVGHSLGSRPEPADFDQESSGLYRVAVAYGRVEADGVRNIAIDYWALGGRHSVRKLATEPSMAQYCGSPQGRRPSEEGLHGCILVEVDETGKPQSQMVPTDVVRWHGEQIELTAEMTAADLSHVLHEHARHLSETAAGRQLLVTWSIVDPDLAARRRGQSLAAQLRRGGLAEQLVDGLRRDFGMIVPGVWTVGLDVVAPREFPASWYEEDTVLGDLLRLVRHYQQHEDEPLDALILDGAENSLPSELEKAVRISGRRDRQRLLRQVAMLGVDLLGGQPTASEPN